MSGSFERISCNDPTSLTHKMTNRHLLGGTVVPVQPLINQMQETDRQRKLLVYGGLKHLDYDGKVVATPNRDKYLVPLPTLEDTPHCVNQMPAQIRC